MSLCFLACILPIIVEGSITEKKISESNLVLNEYLGINPGERFAKTQVEIYCIRFRTIFGDSLPPLSDLVNKIESAMIAFIDQTVSANWSEQKLFKLGSIVQSYQQTLGIHSKNYIQHLLLISKELYSYTRKEFDLFRVENLLEDADVQKKFQRLEEVTYKITDDGYEWRHNIAIFLLDNN